MFGRCVLLTIIVSFVLVAVSGRPELAKNNDERNMHPKRLHRMATRAISSKRGSVSAMYNENEKYPKFWVTQAQQTLSEKLIHRQNTNIAKNVIMFLGDGLSIPTIKASRVYWGQLYNESGEERILSFERFPYVGLSKTYCLDKQVPDSACTATAYLCGIKNNDATIGVTGSVELGDCDASLDEANRVNSIAYWSQLKKKKTGIVTTTKVTDASPAGVYAHTADRDWESDSDSVPTNCKDLAHQLVYEATGKNLNVILGGGRKKFLPNSVIDQEGDPGTRLDGENLIDSWLKTKEGENAHYVWNRTSLLNIPKDTDYLLGLFESDHCNYHLDAKENDPSLAEMTEKAIEVLSKGENGYFLFVEGGRIDHAHHDTKAHKALDETIEFHKAIEKADEMTSAEDTLIVVTADHAHTLSVSGYGDRGNDIFGMPGIGDDHIPYTTLSYANGPGYRPEINGKRADLTDENRNDKNYKFPALAPIDLETHGGDDVAIYSRGPWAHLLTGVIEQNLIPHIMAYASCVGDGLTLCDQDLQRKRKSSNH